MSDIRKVLIKLGNELAQSSQGYRLEVKDTVFNNIAQKDLLSQIQFAELSDKDKEIINSLRLDEISDLTSFLKQNRETLSSAGIDYGHLISNLVLYTREKLKVSALEAANIQLNDEDKMLLNKALRLIEAYLSVLRQIDEISSVSAFEEFLGFSGMGLTTKTSFKGAMSTVSALTPYATKAREILGEKLVEVEINSTIGLEKYMEVGPTAAHLTFELRRFNTFKGTFASNIRNAFLVSFNKLLNDPNTEINKELVKSLKGASAKVIRENYAELAKSNASKNLYEALQDMFFSVATTGTSKNYISKAKIKQNNIKTKLPAVRLPAVKLKIPKIAPIRKVSGQFYSLASLQTLLDGSLVDRVKQNMGDGNRRDILNLRSGRFAESVKVERMSQSREGMITAFYSYMKNPYATFSEGGRQSSPKTRDPKLLIARSIREIAASVVSNRMRSVPV